MSAVAPAASEMAPVTVVGAGPAGLAAAITVACQVRKFLAVKSPPVASRM